MLTLRQNDVNIKSLQKAIRKKAEERNTLVYVENYEKYLTDIEESKDLNEIWKSYTLKYPYAEDIQFAEIVNILRNIFTIDIKTKS